LGVGFLVGSRVGSRVGLCVGFCVRGCVGGIVGRLVGNGVGFSVGCGDGFMDGILEGFWLGLFDGISDGLELGRTDTTMGDNAFALVSMSMDADDEDDSEEAIDDRRSIATYTINPKVTMIATLMSLSLIFCLRRHDDSASCSSLFSGISSRKYAYGSLSGNDMLALPADKSIDKMGLLVGLHEI